MAPLVFRAPSDPAVGRAARCARGRRPAREPSAPAAQPEFAIELVACGAAGVLGAVGPGRPRDRHTRACGSEWSISKPARALRTLRHPPHQWRLRCCVVMCRLEARPGPAIAHRHRSQALLRPPDPPHRRLSVGALQFRMQFPDVCSPWLHEKPGISTVIFQNLKCHRSNCMRLL